MIRVRYRCSHEAILEAAVVEAMPCALCGERRIVSVVAPAPTFRGAAGGPLAVKSPIRPVMIPVVKPSKESRDA